MHKPTPYAMIEPLIIHNNKKQTKSFVLTLLFIIYTEGILGEFIDCIY